MAEMKVELVSVDELKPYEKNTRKHEDKDIESIKESIKQFGFNDPIGIWGKKNLIVEGHGRLLAAKALGMTEVPCIRLDHLTEDQRKAYAIAHNKTAEQSLWDNDILGEELKGLIDKFDMTNFGFGDFEITMLTEDMDYTPYPEEEIEGYEDHEGDYLKKKRVMITYTDEQKETVENLLGLESLKKVVYDITELAK